MFKVDKKAYFRVMIDRRKHIYFQILLCRQGSFWSFRNKANEYFIAKKLQGTAEYLFQIKPQNSL